MGRQKILITEEQLQRYLQEQGLYGDNSDVVDYDLPEYLSDVIILKKLNDFSDVENSVKELYKRLIRIEKGLDDAGSHNKAYSTDTKYASHNRKFKDFEKKEDSAKRDEELKKEISRIEQMIDLQKSKRDDSE